jgi:uncharacterized OB-fold protein
MIECPNCGAEVPLYQAKCAYCGRKNPDAAKYVDGSAFLVTYLNDRRPESEMLTFGWIIPAGAILAACILWGVVGYLWG